MASIPSKARERAEKAKRFRSSWREAIAEMLTPLTFAPQPAISVPATIGEMAAREGLSGLMNLGESIVLPFAAVNILGRSRKLPPSSSDVAEILREGTQSQKAKDFWQSTRTFVDPRGDILEEIPDINAQLTRKATNAVNDIQAQRKLYEVGSLEEFLDHPELFTRYPSLKQVPVEILAQRDSEVVPARPGQPITDAIMRVGALAQSRTPFSSFIHETAHLVQDADNLMQGTSPDWILRKLQTLESLGMIPPGMANPHTANIMYYLSGGEIGARAAEARRAYDRAQRLARLPTTHGGDVFSPNLPIVTPEGGIADKAVLKGDGLDEIKRVARLLANIP